MSVEEVSDARAEAPARIAAKLRFPPPPQSDWGLPARQHPYPDTHYHTLGHRPSPRGGDNTQSAQHSQKARATGDAQFQPAGLCTSRTARSSHVTCHTQLDMGQQHCLLR